MLTSLEGPLAASLRQRTRRVIAPADRTTAAVLVPLLDVAGAAHVLYTRRASTLGHHRGQIAFPGGTADPSDADLCATALRESYEEIGLPHAQVRVLGPLDDIETLTSRFVITPYVGVVLPPYQWTPSPAEVDCVFTAALDALRHPDNARTEQWELSGRQVPIDLYEIDGHVIWGATQRITHNLLRIVENLRGE